MSLHDELEKAGFSKEEAEKLAANEYVQLNFSNKTGNAEHLADKISKIAKFYGFDETQIRKVILSFPPFAGLDHPRVMKGLIDVYGKENEQQIRKVILSSPRFAGYDHPRVMKGLIDVYGKENEQQIRKVILSFPPFAGLDHKRVLWQLGRIGRIAGLSEEEIIENILKNPVLSGYSAKRYLAALDVGRELAKEGLPNDREMLRVFINNCSKSPYVPETKKLRISQARKLGPFQEPPVMKAMRARMQKIQLH